MKENFLARLFEHNNWANLQIIEACSTLSDEQLDAEPKSATHGSIRETLLHLARGQYGYLRQMTLPVDERRDRASVEYADLQASLIRSGEALLALAKGEASLFVETKIDMGDGWSVEPWVLMVQTINHATEHREQIKSMLTALGITPPEIDGWSYGEVHEAVAPIPD